VGGGRKLKQKKKEVCGTTVNSSVKVFTEKKKNEKREEVGGF